MAQSKYAKYVMKQTKPESPNKFVALEGPTDWGGIKHRVEWMHVTKPFVLNEKPHSHKFDKFFAFVSSNPDQPFDFGAEIEVEFGTEGEKHTVNKSTIVCIPKGTVHGPLNFKKVDKPILFCVFDMDHVKQEKVK